MRSEQGRIVPAPKPWESFLDLHGDPLLPSSSLRPEPTGGWECPSVLYFSGVFPLTQTDLLASQSLWPLRRVSLETQVDLKSTEGGAPGCIDPQGEEKLQVRALAVIRTKEGACACIKIPS